MREKHLSSHAFGFGAGLKRIWPVLVSFIVLVAIFSGALARADGPNQVGLVVVHGDGSVVTRCIEFSEDEINGFDVLERSGLDLNYESFGTLGGTICRLDNEGCTFPQKPCFCQCQGAPPCIYWSYWHLIGDEWQYANLGASAYFVSDGDVEGWVWGEGTIGSDATQPPAITFEEVCAAPTSTPTSTSTPISTPTATPAPTNTPQPTSTPEPPTITHFTAERTTINAGESVVLSWDLSDAEVAYLQYEGVEEGVVAPGSKSVAPAMTMVYTLVARNETGETRAEVTITVIPTTDTPVPTGTPPPTFTPVPPLATPLPGETPVSEPIITFSAQALALQAGACTTLYWDVQNASAVYLDEAEVAPQEAWEVCPEGTQVYSLRVVYPGGERTAQITLQVADAAPPPTSTPPVAPTAAVAVAPTSPPTQPTATPINQRAEARPVAKAQATPLSTPRSASEQPAQATKTRRPIWARLALWGGFMLFGAIAAALIAGGVAWWVINRATAKEGYYQDEYEEYYQDYEE